MEKPTEGVLVEFLWGDNIRLREGYVHIGSFENETPDFSSIHITIPTKWADAYLNLLSDLVVRMKEVFIRNSKDGLISPKQNRFQYYEIYEKEHVQQILGYFIDGDSQLTFRDSGILFREEFLAFKNANDRINEFYKDGLWFNPVIENYEKFLATLDNAAKNFSQNTQPDYSGTEIVNINSTFNAWLTSITSYLNYMEKKLKNRNGDEHWTRFHSYTSKEFDQNASYKFLYGLRNYIQHQAPPIHINYKSSLENELPIYEVEVFCLKDELLTSDKWTKLQRDVILNMGERIDISIHAENMMTSLNHIRISHFQDEFSYLRESALYIHELIERIPPGHNRGVYEIHFSDKKIVGMKAYIIYQAILIAIIEDDIYQILKAN